MVMFSDLLKTQMGRLRIIALLEGISFLLLLGIAMPLKYMAGQPGAVRMVGMAHGLLFILYVFYVIRIQADVKWSVKQTVLALVASVVPFGTFYADAKLFRTVEEEQPERA
jgi:integral membrane protein